LRSYFKAILFILIFILFISACTEQNLVVERSSVEIGPRPVFMEEEDPDNLYFHLSILDSGNHPDQEYRVRFLINDPEIKEIINAEEIEVDETFKTQSGESGLVLHETREIKGEIDVKKFKRAIKSGKGVKVELYNDEGIIYEEAVTNFVNHNQ